MSQSVTQSLGFKRFFGGNFAGQGNDIFPTIMKKKKQEKEKKKKRLLKVTNWSFAFGVATVSSI